MSGSARRPAAGLASSALAAILGLYIGVAMMLRTCSGEA